MLLFGFAALILATTSCAQAASVSFNEHIEQYALERGIGVDVVLGVAHNESEGFRPLVRRAPDWPTRHPELKAIIDRAVKKTAARTHYFWSGRVLPATSNDDSVIDRALKLAQSKGGTVLEATMDGVPMPDYAGGDPDAEDIWQYASDAYAAESRGDVYVVKGESLRPGNVWEVYEYPRLKKMSAVKRIFEIKYRRAGPDAPRQIWPELQGCDGVKFLEKEVTCPAGAKMYYGSPKKPVVTAKTTVAKDTKMKVSATGNAPGVVRECTEIMSVEWIMELFEKSGVCEAATAKGDGGKTMTKVKALLTSSNNRNYIQRERLLKMKAKVIGLPIMGALKWMLIDSLVSIDYYEQTAAATASMTRQIDSMVLSATGKSPGLVAAWNAKISTQKGTKAALLLELQKEIAQKAKEAKEAAARKGACGAPATPGKGTIPTTPSKPARMIRRWSTTSPATLSSLESRAQTARRSGPKAAAAPSCPLKTAPQKKVVPRSKAKTKAPPAKTPRVPAKQPARLPPKRTKKVAPRPANRARRTPGKASPPKRTTPKRKPKAVPKPTRRPKGRPRARKGRRK